MADFEVADGTSFMWPNKKTSENQPDWKGEMNYQGQKLKFALFKKMTRNQQEYVLLKIEDDSWKDKNQQSYPKEVTPKPYESDVPF